MVGSSVLAVHRRMMTAHQIGSLSLFIVSPAVLVWFGFASFCFVLFCCAPSIAYSRRSQTNSLHHIDVSLAAFLHLEKYTRPPPLLSRQACRSLHRSPRVGWQLNVVCFVVFSRIAVVLRSFLHLFAMRVSTAFTSLPCLLYRSTDSDAVQCSVFHSTFALIITISALLLFPEMSFVPLCRFLLSVSVCVWINLRLLLQCLFLCWAWVLFLLA